MCGAEIHPAAGVEGAGPTARLAAEFPGWRVFRSRGSRRRWWATRGGNQNFAEGRGDGWAMTVDADDEAGLRQALAAQESLVP
jgi:hypothetical protein